MIAVGAELAEELQGEKFLGRRDENEKILRK
jgi:hypothetical protein